MIRTKMLTDTPTPADALYYPSLCSRWALAGGSNSLHAVQFEVLTISESIGF